MFLHVEVFGPANLRSRCALVENAVSDAWVFTVPTFWLDRTLIYTQVSSVWRAFLANFLNSDKARNPLIYNAQSPKPGAFRSDLKNQ